MGEVKVVAYISETAMNIVLKQGDRYYIGPHQDAVMKPLVTLDDHTEAMREKDAEIARYRQAIWDARAIMGFDNDGDPTPESVAYPHLADLLRRDASEFRSDYDAAIREIGTDEKNLAEAMRTIAEHDGDMQAMESLASEHKESAERAEAQRDKFKSYLEVIAYSEMGEGGLRSLARAAIASAERGEG